MNKLLLLILILAILQISHLRKLNHECKHHKNQETLKKKGIQRQKASNSLLYEELYGDDNRRNLEEEDLGISTDPQPIRITVEYQLSTTNQQTIDVIKAGIDVSIKFLQDTMYVYPEQQNIVIKDQEFKNGYEGYCTQQLYGSVTFDDASQSTGFSNTDLVLFVTNVNKPDETFLAEASGCQWHHDRPTAGFVNFNAAFLENTDYYDPNNLADFEYHLETCLHEIYHVMGFSGSNIGFFRKDGRRQSEAAINKIVFGKEIRGYETAILASPEVLKEAKRHFGCDTADGAQLENEGGEGSLGSHFERLMFYNEIMNPLDIQADSVTSAFTLAFLKDTGHYADVDMSYAEPMQWGQNRGCDFLTECDSTFPEFAAPSDQHVCSFYHFGVGYANVEDFTDGCHVTQNYGDVDCTDPSTSTPHEANTYENFSTQSKCFDSTFIKTGETQSYGARCYQYTCNADHTQVDITVSKDGTDHVINCTSDGAQMDPPGGSGLDGKLNCPRSISEFCDFPVPCANYCSKNGYCNRQNGKSSCYCIDGFAGEDCSTTCAGSKVLKNGSCVDSCGTGFYYHKGTKVCAQCDGGCSECNGPTSNDCQQCEFPKYESGSDCVSTCPKGTFANKSNGKCESCSSDCEQCRGSADNCLVLPVFYAGADDIAKDTHDGIVNFMVVGFLVLFIQTLLL